jgi:alkylation response protein AidB-like acyl-CoA dehydrogenase
MSRCRRRWPSCGHQVRDFLAAELDAGAFSPGCDAWLTGFSPEFSRKPSAHGWLGLAWPERYGGHARSAAERYVVIEEMLAAGAPVAAHWVADRQTGLLSVRYGSEAQRLEFLPAIARGECCFAIGRSEPDAGSDLAAVRTRATQVDGGWVVEGRKVWTSHAHRSHFMLTLCRTAPVGEERRQGLSQLIVHLATPGGSISAHPSSLWWAPLQLGDRR